MKSSPIPVLHRRSPPSLSNPWRIFQGYSYLWIEGDLVVIFQRVVCSNCKEDVSINEHKVRVETKLLSLAGISSIETQPQMGFITAVEGPVFCKRCLLSWREAKLLPEEEFRHE